MGTTGNPIGRSAFSDDELLRTRWHQADGRGAVLPSGRRSDWQPFAGNTHVS